MSPIRIEVADHIAVVTIDSPPVNAMTREMYAEMTEVFDSFYENKDVRVAILTGAGDRAFCAGMNLQRRKPGEPEPKNDYGRTGREAFNAIYDCAVPVIGAINGPTLGTGVSIAACCDWLIASERATFGLPEIELGVLGGARHLARMFPQSIARRMFLTAERATAEEALRLGAVAKVVPHERLMEEAMKDAKAIARKIPMGVRIAKEALNVGEWLDMKSGYRHEQIRSFALRGAEDQKEARQAYIEKRAPVFKGR
jgi:enoyl-CoA hydratase